MRLDGDVMPGKPALLDSGRGAGWTRSIIVLVLVALAAGAPLVFCRVLAGHDIVVYLINAQQTAENLRSGEVFPAWGGGFNAGYGSPSLLFFPPLTSYLHGFPVLAGIPVILGVCFWSLAGLFLSGLAMFGWLRSTGYGHGALPGAVVYMVSSYRLIDLYHRSALAEHWAFVWPPLILWVASSAGLRPGVRSALTAFFVAALLMSNIPLGILFGFGLACWFISSRILSGRRLVVALGVLLGFGIAAFAIVPQILSSTLLSVDQFYGAEAGRFRPSANTLFSGDLHAWDFNTQVSVAFIAAFVLVLVAYFLIPPERRTEVGVRAAVIGAAICVVMAAKPAGLVWEALPVLSKFQFPWRIASLLTFGLAFIVAHLDRRRGWLLVVLVVAATLPFSGWVRTQPVATFCSQEPSRPPAGTVFPDPYTAWEAGSGGWYWRHHNLAEIWFLAANVKPFLIPELSGNRARELDSIRNRPAVVLEHTEARVRVVSWGSTRRELAVETPAAGTLMWRAIEFPRMEVTVDGSPVPVRADSTTGLVVHGIPAGEHRVVWSWTPFPALRAGRVVSATSIVVSCALLLVGLVGWWRHQRHQRDSTVPGMSK